MAGRLLFPDRSFAAFLFDMDGTILTSIAAAERVWSEWARRHHVDLAAFLPTIHGFRAVETVRRLALPGVDPDREAEAITRAEMEDVGGIDALDGAAGFLASLPEGRWAVVTSAPRPLADRRLQAAGLPAPPLMVTAEDVARGKPAPDGFLLAARRLGCAAAESLVFEDAAPGIAAAEAAGAAVAVVTATHVHPVETRHPSIPNFGGLTVRVSRGSRLEDLTPFGRPDRAVVSLSRRQQESDRTTLRVGPKVDFGRDPPRERPKDLTPRVAPFFARPQLSCVRTLYPSVLTKRENKIYGWGYANMHNKPKNKHIRIVFILSFSKLNCLFRNRLEYSYCDAAVIWIGIVRQRQRGPRRLRRVQCRWLPGFPSWVQVSTLTAERLKSLPEA